MIQGRRPFLSRFHGFLVVSGVLIGLAVAIAGWLVGSFFERHVLAEEEARTVEIIRAQARQHLAEKDFATGSPGGHEALKTFLEGLPRIFRIKVFEPGGTIVWSNEPRLIGAGFPDNDFLRSALEGQVTTVLGMPSRWEHVFERNRQYIAEVYVPVVLPGSSRVAGVIETYKDMTELVTAIRHVQWLIWATAGGIGLALYAALAAVVWQASARELGAIRQLEAQNRELTLLQRFTQSVLRPLDLAQVASSTVRAACEGLGLRSAALWRVPTEAPPVLLAAWPAGTEPAPLGAFAGDALARRERVVQGTTVAVPLATDKGPAHIFAGDLGPMAPAPAATLQTLDIMLHEAAIALANVRLFTEIREAHERLAAIMAGIADHMMILDRNMRIVWMNGAATQVVGADGVGRRCYDVMGGGPEACEGCPAIRTLQSGGVERGVRSHLDPEGKRRYLDLVTAPLRDPTGTVHQVLEVARDITDLVEMEERLKVTNQTLLETQTRLVEQERLAAVGQLVVSLHHAILNPLTGILGALQVVRQSRPAAPEVERAIAEAEQQVRKIEQLVRRLPSLQQTAETPYVGATTMLDLERVLGDLEKPGAV